MKQQKNKQMLNMRAQFRSKSLEDAYYTQQIASVKTYVRYVILVAGIVFFAISLFDYTYNDDVSVFLRSTVARGVVLLLAIIAFIAIRQSTNTNVICGAITFFPLVLVVGYIYILAQQAAQGLFSQAMAIMIVLFCTTMLPNRWLNLVFVDIFITVFFLAYSTTYITTVSPSDYTEVAIYLTVTLVFVIVVQFRSNITRREKYLWEQQLETQSITDKLTGLYNRLWFDHTLAEWCFGGKINRFSLVLMDIDNFKNVNDTHGHLAGDKVLIDSAQVVRSSVRSTDLLARWGGEEYVLLLPDVAAAKAAEIAENIRKNIEATEFDKVRHITFSFGVAAYEPGDEPDSLVKKADKMLYEAKRTGKNRVVAMEQQPA